VPASATRPSHVASVSASPHPRKTTIVRRVAGTNKQFAHRSARTSVHAADGSPRPTRSRARRG
jgi:hypothetical protein